MPRPPKIPKPPYAPTSPVTDMMLGAPEGATPLFSISPTPSVLGSAPTRKRSLIGGAA